MKIIELVGSNIVIDCHEAMNMSDYQITQLVKKEMEKFEENRIKSNDKKW